MYALYILSHILIAASIPLFMAALLPISTLSTLVIDKNWQHLSTGVKHPVFLTMLAISTALIISSVFSIAPLHSLEAALKTAILLICFGYLWGSKLNTPNKLTEKQTTALLLTFASTAIAIACLNILIHLDHLAWLDSTLNRQLVLLALFFWPLSLYFNISKQRYLFWGMVTLFTLFLFAGFSETATLMFLIGLFTYCFFKFLPGSNRTHTTLFALGLIAITFAPLLIAIINPPILNEWLANLPLSKQHHYNIWVECTKLIWSVLPTGIGIDTTELLDLETSFAGHILPLHHPHNLAIELLLELGILGGVLLIFGLVVTTRLFYTTPKTHQPTLAAILVTICLLYSVAFSFWQEWRTAAIAGALIIFHRFITESQQPENPKEHSPI